MYKMTKFNNYKYNKFYLLVLDDWFGGDHDFVWVWILILKMMNWVICLIQDARMMTKQFSSLTFWVVASSHKFLEFLRQIVNFPNLADPPNFQFSQFGGVFDPEISKSPNLAEFTHNLHTSGSLNWKTWVLVCWELPPTQR